MPVKTRQRPAARQELIATPTTNGHHAQDWRTFRTIDLFAGIGGIRLAFERVGGRSVFSSEWDEDAQVTYEANFGERPAGDITRVRPEDIPDHEILLAGFPCQPFSIIGEKKGFADTRGTLFFNIEEILRVKRPPAFLLENVKQLKTHDHGRTLKTILDHLHALGYFVHVKVLNALDFGLPQKRERTIFVGFAEDLDFSFPKPLGTKPRLEDVLEPDDAVDSSLFASPAIQKNRKKKCKVTPFYPSVWHENKGGNISVLPFSCALRAGASYNYLLVNGVRRFTAREMLRLQGYPDSFKIPVSLSQIRKQAGNSVPVPMIEAVAREMLKSLRAHKRAPRLTQLECLPLEGELTI